jgi:hypothetical protein
VSYESSEIHSALVVARPGGQCLLPQKQHSSDIPRYKNLRNFSDCDEQTMLLVRLRDHIHCCTFWKNSLHAKRKFESAKSYVYHKLILV